MYSASHLGHNQSYTYTRIAVVIYASPTAPHRLHAPTLGSSCSATVARSFIMRCAMNLPLVFEAPPTTRRYKRLIVVFCFYCIGAAPRSYRKQFGSGWDTAGIGFMERVAAEVMVLQSKAHLVQSYIHTHISV